MNLPFSGNLKQWTTTSQKAKNLHKELKKKPANKRKRYENKKKKFSSSTKASKGHTYKENAKSTTHMVIIILI
jgi:hypothetical protein